jgi:hypothetical protein
VTPTYVQKLVKYPTDYVLNKIPDPMRQVLRPTSHADEKDNRGRCWTPGCAATCSARRAALDRMMKLFLAIIPFSRFRRPVDGDASHVFR